jgi:hypothetical protein
MVSNWFETQVNKILQAGRFGIQSQVVAMGAVGV